MCCDSRSEKSFIVWHFVGLVLAREGEQRRGIEMLKNPPFSILVDNHHILPHFCLTFFLDCNIL